MLTPKRLQNSAAGESASQLTQGLRIRHLHFTTAVLCSATGDKSRKRPDRPICKLVSHSRVERSE